MAYRLSGHSTELCSCDTPCPCAFGQTPSGGRCEGIFAFDVEQGEVDGVSVAGTKAILAAAFNGPWTGGNFTAALILDANASEQQRDALTRVLSGQLGGDAANLAALIGDMKGVFTAPIDIRYTNGQISVRAGELAEGSGALLKGLDASTNIEITNAHYPLPRVTAGKASKTKVKLSGLEYEHDGSGMWTGPFELKG
jgi:hypothetical protein